MRRLSPMAVKGGTPIMRNVEWREMRGGKACTIRKNTLRMLNNWAASTTVVQHRTNIVCILKVLTAHCVIVVWPPIHRLPLSNI